MATDVLLALNGTETYNIVAANEDRGFCVETEEGYTNTLTENATTLIKAMVPCDGFTGYEMECNDGAYARMSGYSQTELFT